MWRIGRAPNNASKWQMGFNSVRKGLISEMDVLERIKERRQQELLLI
jgi:hypothetical protein